MAVLYFGFDGLATADEEAAIVLDLVEDGLWVGSTDGDLTLSRSWRIPSRKTA